MLPSLETIKEERKKLHITQKKLADMTGVSTSMINQIESKRCRPSYNTAKKIFESLAKIEGHISPRTAGNICSTKIEKLSPTNTVSDAGKIMHRKKIDQIHNRNIMLFVPVLNSPLLFFGSYPAFHCSCK